MVKLIADGYGKHIERLFDTRREAQEAAATLPQGMSYRYEEVDDPAPARARGKR